MGPFDGPHFETEGEPIVSVWASTVPWDEIPDDIGSPTTRARTTTLGIASRPISGSAVMTLTELKRITTIQGKGGPDRRLGQRDVVLRFIRRQGR